MSQLPERSDEAPGRRLERWRWVLVAVFGYGTAAHVVQLAMSTGHPYSGIPRWVAAFFISLTAVDPVIALGLAWCRRWAVWCALLVLVLDAAANGYTDYVVAPATGITPDRVGQGVVTMLAVAVATTARPLDHWLTRR